MQQSWEKFNQISDFQERRGVKNSDWKSGSRSISGKIQKGMVTAMKKVHKNTQKWDD